MEHENQSSYKHILAFMYQECNKPAYKDSRFWWGLLIIGLGLPLIILLDKVQSVFRSSTDLT